ncbi:MAG: WD40 repeat domain-containing protein [Thermodesulfobacteriota bacterium]
MLITFVSDGVTRELAASAFPANAVAISPLQIEVAVAFDNGIVGVWTLPELKPKWRKRLEHSASAVSFHPEGNSVAFGSSAGVVTVFNDKGTLKDRWQGVRGGVWVLKWRGDELFSGGSDGWLRKWAPGEPGPLTRALPKAEAFSWEGSSLRSFSHSSSWLDDGKGIGTVVADYKNIKAAAGKVAVIMTERSVALQMLSGERLDFPDFPDRHKASKVTISPDGQYVAIYFSDKDPSPGIGKIAIWNWSEEEVRWLSEIPAYPKAMAFYRSSLFAAAGAGSRLGVWKVDDGVLVADREENLSAPVYALAFLDDKILVAGSLMGRIELLPIDDLKITMEESTVPVGAVSHIAILRDRSIISIDGDGIAWFDSELKFKGRLLVTTENLEDARYAEPDPSGNWLAVKLQSRRVVLVPLDLKRWIEVARKRATIGFILGNANDLDYH